MIADVTMVNLERYNRISNFTKFGISKTVQKITYIIILIFLVFIASNSLAGTYSEPDLGQSFEPYDETVIVECCEASKIEGHVYRKSIEAIRFHGPIRPGDSKKVLKIFEKYRDKILFIYLDSLGGDVREAIIIGRLVSRFHLITWVKEGDKCFSACTAIFVAGDNRLGLGTLGIHRPRFEAQYFANLDLGEAKKKYGEMLKNFSEHFRSFYIAEDMIKAMIKTPPSDIKILSWDETERYKMQGENPAVTEWIRAKCGGLSEKENDLLTTFRGGSGPFDDILMELDPGALRKHEALKRKYSAEYFENLKEKKSVWQTCRNNAVEAEKRKVVNKYFGH